MESNQANSFITALLLIVLEHALIYKLLIKKKRGQCINIIFVAIYFLPPIFYDIYWMSVNGNPIVYTLILGVMSIIRYDDDR